MLNNRRKFNFELTEDVSATFKTDGKRNHEQ